MLPIGSVVEHRVFGVGVVLGYYRTGSAYHLIEFVKGKHELHDGHGQGTVRGGELVRGKASHCYYLTSGSLELVEDFKGNV